MSLIFTNFNSKEDEPKSIYFIFKIGLSLHIMKRLKLMGLILHVLILCEPNSTHYGKVLNLIKI